MMRVEQENTHEASLEQKINERQSQILQRLAEVNHSLVCIVPHRHERGGLALKKDGIWNISGEFWGVDLDQPNLDDLLKEYLVISGGLWDSTGLGSDWRRLKDAEALAGEFPELENIATRYFNQHRVQILEAFIQKLETALEMLNRLGTPR